MITWVLVVLTAALVLGYNIISTRSNLDSAVLLNYWLFVTLLVASLILTRLVSFILVKILFPRFTGKVSTELLRLSVEFITFGALFILNANLILDANLSTLLTTSAVITVILGFALQATLGNLFEGLSMQIHQPFAIGDGLEFGDYYGTVESLTWRAIALRQLNRF
jgi:small-conductance mechanosensitive channel